MLLFVVFVMRLPTEAEFPWTDRDKNTRRPLSSSCMYCRCVIAKLFRSGFYKDKAKTRTALGHLCRSVSPDLDVRNGFLLAHEKYMAQKKTGAPRSTAPLLSVAPRQAVQTQQSTSSSIRGSEFDLVPENIFLQFSRGKTFKECGAKVISIDRPSGGLLTGAHVCGELEPASRMLEVVLF